MALISCCLSLNLSTANRKSVFVSMVSNQSRSVLALVSGKFTICLANFLSPLNFIIYMN